MDRAVPPAVTTVVISHNRRDRLLHSLPRQSPPVMLVDNGSTDGTAEAVSRQLPSVHVVRLDRNRGAPARNVGVALAGTRYVAFADDDSWWAPGALERAARILDDHPRVGLLAGRILVGEQQREDALCRVLAASPLPRRPDLPGPAILGFASCGAVVRRDAFLEAGGFDPVVHFPGEETRLALDLAAAGWDLCYVREVLAHHHPAPGGDGRARRRLITRNALLTAVMRRPWPVVWQGSLRAVASDPDTRRGALAAVPRLPAALAARRRLPPDVEARMRLLEAAEAGSGRAAA